MHYGIIDVAQAFALVQHELLLFAAVFFLIGAMDEVAVDALYVWLRVTGRLRSQSVARTIEDDAAPLRGRAALFIPAWQEERVIEATLLHALAVWSQRELTVFVGCYPNDPATIARVSGVTAVHDRLRLVVNEQPGPTSKADCLNALYRAMAEDERASGEQYRTVILQDAEDMVDPAALRLLDDAIESADFVQLPVMALPRAGSRWIAGHYTDEFAEAHRKTMAVRDWLGAALPGAGVGSAIDRHMLGRLADAQDGLPFAAQSLTEDYELGLRIANMGGRSRFLRRRASDGRLIATRAFFPARLDHAVRQKTAGLTVSRCRGGTGSAGKAGSPACGCSFATAEGRSPPCCWRSHTL